MRIRLPILMAPVVLTVLSTSSLGSPQGPPQPPGQREPMRVVVDGSKNPESIPDRVALGVLFPPLAVRAIADPPALHRSLRSLTLSKTDLELITRELAQLQDRLVEHRRETDSAFAAVRANPTADTVAGVRDVMEGLNTLAEDTYSRLRLSLSPDGAVKLHAYLLKEKTRMRVMAPIKATP